MEAKQNQLDLDCMQVNYLLIYLHAGSWILARLRPEPENVEDEGGSAGGWAHSEWPCWVSRAPQWGVQDHAVK